MLIALEVSFLPDSQLKLSIPIIEIVRLKYQVVSLGS